jgi:hypothetical protein
MKLLVIGSGAETVHLEVHSVLVSELLGHARVPPVESVRRRVAGYELPVLAGGVTSASANVPFSTRTT